MGLEDVLTTALENIINLIPMRVVNQNQQGVRFFKGNAGYTLEKGIYWYVPFIGSLERVDITDGYIDIPLFTIDSNIEGEKRTYSIDGGLVYCVRDARRYLLKLADNDSIQTLTVISRGVLANEIAKSRSAFMRQPALVKRTLGKINTEIAEYGLLGKQLYIHTATKEPINIRLLGDKQAIQNGS